MVAIGHFGYYIRFRPHLNQGTFSCFKVQNASGSDIVNSLVAIFLLVLHWCTHVFIRSPSTRSGTLIDKAYVMHFAATL